MTKKVIRFDIWLVSLDPTIGKEIKKTRPCLILSPNELSLLSTVLVAPLTSKGFPLIIRVPCEFQGQEGLILLDQIRAIDKSRLVKKLGVLNETTAQTVCDVCVSLFSF